MSRDDVKARQTASLATPSKFSPEASRDISGAVNLLLADTVALYFKTKNFHWHMSGPHFRDYHLMLDEQSDQIFAMTDPMAERVRKIGGTTLHSIGHIARLKRVLDNDADYVTPGDMLAELRDDNAQLAANMRETHALCDEHNDVATASLLEVWIDETERRAWFLFEAGRSGDPAATDSFNASAIAGRDPMTSLPIRDPVVDHLLTPRNAALIIIDYQPVQVTSVASMDRRTLVNNIVSVAKGARLYDLPVVLSTVNVKTGRNAPTIHQLQEVLNGIEPLDRTTINAWEDREFVAAVKATGRKKLIMTALWTEACLSFPALDAMREGYEVYPVVDAVGGTSLQAHDAALMRMTSAGAKPISWVQMLCELQRDWQRGETAGPFAEIVFAVEGH